MKKNKKLINEEDLDKVSGGAAQTGREREKEFFGILDNMKETGAVASDDYVKGLPNGDFMSYVGAKRRNNLPLTEYESSTDERLTDLYNRWRSEY